MNNEFETACRLGLTDIVKLLEKVIKNRGGKNA